MNVVITGLANVDSSKSNESWAENVEFWARTFLSGGIRVGTTGNEDSFIEKSF